MQKKRQYLGENLSFDPYNFATKRQFGSSLFHIRPAKSSDRDLVWQGYKNAPKDFFKFINPISKDLVNRWYPQDKKLDYKYSLPFNVMLLDTNHKEIAFAGNMTLVFTPSERNKHRAQMGVGVMPRFQKLGIGSYLTELSVEVAKAIPGIYRLELQVCVNNYARTIYPKYGYKEEAILHKYFLLDDGSLEDVLVMNIIFEDKL